MTADLDLRRRRAAYRAAHRGTKEMDLLLGRYAEARLGSMDAEELGRFESLLIAPDPQLQNWILDAASVPEPRYAELIATLREFHGLTPSRQ
ncbi:MAG: succinate dehydrogenase assembly factor 2 [Hyphomicrobiaceae bacterium]